MTVHRLVTLLVACLLAVACQAGGRFYVGGEENANCGNGVVDPGETCDPPSSCPAACDDADPCTLDTLEGSAAACSASCTHGSVTRCAGGDGCCPAGCDAGGDADCSTSCGDGVVDPGETCDPPSSCPAACNDGNACTEDTLTGSAANCSARCSFGAVTACAAGDGCCPAGCTSATDGDCSLSCGDGVVDPGETCDPPSSCPAACDDGNDCTSDLLTGSAANCSAACSHSSITGCAGGDGCCPAGCTSGSDDDCSAACGNGVVDPGETCDPPSSCPATCDDGVACTFDQMTGSAANCSAACSHSSITGCAGGDGCCPAGCTSWSDDDCSASCGNGVVDPGETCDPPASCPTSCDDGNDCTTDLLTGSAANCNAACSATPITACTDGDGCCASGCTTASDDDCSPSCGNGVVDPGETCDPPASCPTACDDGNDCTTDLLTGSAANCNAACSATPITACTDGDGCCATGCTTANDDDCSAFCGNGVVDPGETCDPPASCPSSCADTDPCTTDTLTGSASTCNVACGHTPITACTGGDGCCPSGCTSGSDGDCEPSCGNGVIDPGETCDPPASCPASCADTNPCTTDTMTGSASTCNVVCGHTPITACTGGDGCCPSSCTPATDGDCTVDCRNPSAWPSGWATFEDQVVALVNSERASAHMCGSTSYPAVGPVTMQADIREAARCHSLDMAVNDFFDHTGSDGSAFYERMATAGYTGSAICEDIGAGYTSAAAVVAGWMASPGHCSCIMSGSANDIGIGYAYESASTWHHYWTLDMGRH